MPKTEVERRIESSEDFLSSKEGRPLGEPEQFAYLWKILREISSELKRDLGFFKIYPCDDNTAEIRFVKIKPREGLRIFLIINTGKKMNEFRYRGGKESNLDGQSEKDWQELPEDSLENLDGTSDTGEIIDFIKLNFSAKKFH
jgi:hypothetical protein